MVPAAAMGVALPGQMPRRWLHSAIPLAVFALLLVYLWARNLREYSVHSPALGGTGESRPWGSKASPKALTALSRLPLSGCGSGTQSCIAEGPPPFQVRYRQGWNWELLAGS